MSEPDDEDDDERHWEPDDDFDVEDDELDADEILPFESEHDDDGSPAEDGEDEDDEELIEELADFGVGLDQLDDDSGDDDGEVRGSPRDTSREERDASSLEEDGERSAAAGPERPPVRRPVTPVYPASAPCTARIGQGDCLLSLAARYHVDSDAIWNAGPNAELRAERVPEQLLPGDEVFIPAGESRVRSVSTTRRHRFRLTTRLANVVLRFLDAGEPRGGLAYSFEVDGERREGTLDGDGRLVEAVSVRAVRATVTLHTASGDERYPVRLGHLNPIDDDTGVQARLNHLGFVCGEVDGWAGPRTRGALRAFQLVHGLTPSGEVDDATRQKLKEVHGA